MKYISLFSGIGGVDLGFDRAGMTCVAQVEKDEKAREVLARHWPDVMRFEDVRDVGRYNLPAADVLCGGFPCQDVSVAGRRAGLAGERSGLWFEFHRIVSETRPRFVVIENVPGLLSSNRGADFAVILQGLVELRYSVVWRVLDAQHFGLAQRRKRLFIVASLGSGAAAEILFESESGGRNSAQSRETGQDIAATVTARAGKGGFTDPINDGLIATGYGETGHGYWQEGIQTIRARGMDDANVIAFDRTQAGQWEEDITGPLRAGVASAEGVNDGKADQWCVMTAGTLGAEMGRNRGMGQENETDFLVCDLQQVTSPTNQSQPLAIAPLITPQQRIVAFAERTRINGRNFEMQDDLAYALTDPGRGGQAHSSRIAGTFGVRRLTPTECERLQGFPDGWTAGQSDSARYRQLGNAVAVPVAEWIGWRLAGRAERPPGALVPCP